jgi:AAA+ ATPase superfamily predicted ATPase
MAATITGRLAEKEILKDIIESTDPQLVAIYGRRRVGKTFLIRNELEKELIFEFSGIHNATLDQQLENFANAMTTFSKNGLPLAKPKNWSEAFKILIEYTTPLLKKQKKVIFFDEFPWINTARSGFMQAFENFWNVWGTKQNNLVVIICGSAAAWMIKQVIHNRGGLHNRVTKSIRLLPFTLSETEAFLKARNIELGHYQTLQLYMVMGGVPHYLKEIKKGESSTQAIDRICFSKDGLLKEEFKILYQSLFDDASKHMSVIRALAKKNTGLTRNEIIDLVKLKSGGWLSEVLEELTQSGFIKPYVPFEKTAKDSIYKLTDEYSRFYLKYIEHSRSEGKGTWASISRETTWKSWSGNAFESVCLKHIDAIKKALGIEGVKTEISSWRYHPISGEKGAQIDLVIDRQDHCINICEMKFSINEFSIEKSYSTELEHKINAFRDQTKTRKTLFLTMVTTFGVKQNANYTRIVQSEIKMDALFKP